MSRYPGSARGFSLIEILVALSVMALIAAVLIESLQVAGHAWQHVTRLAAGVDEVSRTQQFLRQHLQTIQPGQAATFAGEGGTLEFSSTAASQPDTRSTHYRLQLGGQGANDVEVRYHRQPGEESGEPLLRHVAALAIEYWDPSAGDSGQWLSHWPTGAKLPALIHIDVRFPDDDPRHWPPLYVEPRVDTNADCVFDIVSRKCREST